VVPELDEPWRVEPVGVWRVELAGLWRRQLRMSSPAYRTTLIGHDWRARPRQHPRWAAEGGSPGGDDIRSWRRHKPASSTRHTPTGSTRHGSSSSGTTHATAENAKWDQLAQCESTQNWDANTGNGYKGGLQFNDTTWRSYGGRQYAPSADQAQPRTNRSLWPRRSSGSRLAGLARVQPEARLRLTGRDRRGADTRRRRHCVEGRCAGCRAGRPCRNAPVGSRGCTYPLKQAGAGFATATPDTAKAPTSPNVTATTPKHQPPSDTSHQVPP